jgi:hydrogenase nickel incorporation protein HypA/HybF
MHEVGIMNDVLDIAVEAALEAGAERITLLKLKVGELSGVVPDSLTFAFDVLAKDTIANGAEFSIETIPATYQCADCGREFVGIVAVLCSFCQGKTAISHGYELIVSSIEVS